jgi:hypothetical protein
MRCAGGRERLFHLTEDLRFAHDQGVEAGGDAKRVTRHLDVGDIVDMRLERRPVDTVICGDEIDQR